MFDWIEAHQTAVLWLTVGSVIMFVVTLVVVPALIVRIPADYFAHAKRPPSKWARRGRFVQVAMAIGMNLLGVVFIVAGIAMLLLPGQGLLTLLVGIFMLDFPAKYRFEKWILSHRRVLKSIDWLRRRAGREPLQVGG